MDEFRVRLLIAPAPAESELCMNSVNHGVSDRPDLSVWAIIRSLRSAVKRKNKGQCYGSCSKFTESGSFQASISSVCVCVCGVCGGLGCLTLFSSLTMCGDHCDRKDFIVAFRPLW